ncbi:DUF7289 family protein [Halosegnis marinus]|uniref:DUF7289 family protein n=1 Tax=Halosegnis marinus TaxID=3034023 RepID=UPI003621233A
MTRPDERAQSAPLGVALLLGLTILGTTAVVAFGGAALTDTQDQSEFARAEQAMTLFDSQAAQVALGDSNVQTVDFGRGDGTYSVDPDAGSVSIVQLDCDDDGPDGAPYDNESDVLGGDDAYILDPTPLGAVRYTTTDGRTLAYQGGGVWSGDGDGGSAMVSPPEFHYRDATLTLPIVLTRGGGGASGAARATVTAPRDPVRVFPNASDAFPTSSPDCGGEPFRNPITDGNVIVRIESEYARAWGEYFETRTTGEVTYFDTDGDGADDDVVTISLVSLGQIGDFEMPGEGGSVTVSGASGGHATSEFAITLSPDDSDSANFNNLQWSMYVDEGQQQFEIHARKSGGSGCSGGTSDLAVSLNIYYSDDGGDTYDAWHADDAYEATCVDGDGDGVDDEIRLTMDFVDDEDGDGSYVDYGEGDVNLTYTSNIDQLVYFKNAGDDFGGTSDSTTFSGHGDWESETYTVGDTESIDRLLNHYFAELPAEFDLAVDDKNSDTVNEGASSGRIVTGGRPATSPTSTSPATR